MKTSTAVAKNSTKACRKATSTKPTHGEMTRHGACSMERPAKKRSVEISIFRETNIGEEYAHCAKHHARLATGGKQILFFLRKNLNKNKTMTFLILKL